MSWVEDGLKTSPTGLRKIDQIIFVICLLYLYKNLIYNSGIISFVGFNSETIIENSLLENIS